MTDPNQPPVTPPSANQPPPPPAYAPPAASAYGSAPDAPAYSDAPDAPAPYTSQGYAAPSGADKYNVLAIVSLVSAFFVSLAAIICGHIALNQIKKTGEKGRGLAIAGLVLGYAGLVIGAIVFIFFILAWIAAINSGYMSPTY